MSSQSSSNDYGNEEQEEQTLSQMIRQIMNKNGRIEQNGVTLRYNNASIERIFQLEHHQQVLSMARQLIVGVFIFLLTEISMEVVDKVCGD